MFCRLSCIRWRPTLFQHPYLEFRQSKSSAFRLISENKVGFGLKKSWHRVCLKGFIFGSGN
jgi:hypothetical protein